MFCFCNWSVGDNFGLTFIFIRITVILSFFETPEQQMQIKETIIYCFIIYFDKNIPCISFDAQFVKIMQNNNAFIY